MYCSSQKSRTFHLHGNIGSAESPTGYDHEIFHPKLSSIYNIDGLQHVKNNNMYERMKIFSEVDSNYCALLTLTAMATNARFCNSHIDLIKNRFSHIRPKALTNSKCFSTTSGCASNPQSFVKHWKR